MKVTKISNYQNTEYADKENYKKDADKDLVTLFLALQGRLRYGSGTSGENGENIAGEFREFTSGTANTEFAVAHGLGSVPMGALTMWQDKAGDIFQGPTTGTLWTSGTAYFKTSATNIRMLIFLLK